MDGKPTRGPNTATGRLFRRSDFLGTNPPLRTFYGPGQPPTAAPGAQLNKAGLLITAGYTPPTDWPPAGALLRRPQVAWLTLALPYCRTTYRFAYPAQTVAYGGGLLAGVGDDYFSYSGAAAGAASVELAAYDSGDLDHPEVAEYARLRAAMESARATVEALRPGRTYVSIWDWYDPEWAGIAYPISGNILHLTAPSRSVSTVPYFGTDFLHVYCGAPLEDRRGDFGDWDRILQDNQSDWSSLTSLTSSATRVTNALPSFGLFRVVVFSPDAGSDPPAPYPSPGPADISFAPYPPYPTSGTPDDGIYVLSPFLPDEPAWVYPPASGILVSSREAAAEEAEDIAEARQAGIAVYADQTASYYARSLESFRASASAAGSAGSVVRVAGTYQDVTASSLVRTIAEAFGFDPGTGKDLG